MKDLCDKMRGIRLRTFIVGAVVVVVVDVSGVIAVPRDKTRRFMQKKRLWEEVVECMRGGSRGSSRVGRRSGKEVVVVIIVVVWHLAVAHCRHSPSCGSLGTHG